MQRGKQPLKLWEWKERYYIGEGYGRDLGVDIFCEECGSISLSRKQLQGRFWRTLLKKNNEESKVTGNRSHPSKRFWNRSNEVRMQIAVPRQRAVPTPQCSMTIGRVSRKTAGRKESSGNGPLKGFGKCTRR